MLTPRRNAREVVEEAGDDHDLILDDVALLIRSNDPPPPFILTIVIFFYPMASLEEMDASGPMHASDAFRDGVGEAGRNQMREVNRTAVESTQRLIFQLRPDVSVLPPDWAQTDAFWAVKPPAPTGRKPSGNDR